MKRTTPREHGTKACYVFGEWGGDSANGCRCDKCRAAIARYEQERARRIEPAYVSASPVREHLAWLSTQGVGWKRAAAVAGLSSSTVWKLLYGDPKRNRAPSKRVRPETAAKLLAVTPSHGAGGSRVDAAATEQHIATLLFRGWTKKAISEAIGNKGPLQVGGTGTVLRKTAAAIAALLDQSVPETVGKSWSAHYKRQEAPLEEPAEPTPIAYDARDRVTLALVELLEARIDQNGWRRDAACRGRASWMFFPARGDHRTLAAAKKVCGACLVRDECLAANIGERDGVYGGLSARERRTMREGIAS